MANTERHKTVPLFLSLGPVHNQRKENPYLQFLLYAHELGIFAAPMIVSQFLRSTPQKHKVYYLTLTLNPVFTVTKPAVLIPHVQDRICFLLPTLLFLWPYRKLYEPVLPEAKSGKVFSYTLTQLAM